MPQPLSTTRTSFHAPCSTATSIRVAPASTAFSISSLTTLAGRSITSPAAILLTTLGGSWRIAVRAGGAIIVTVGNTPLGASGIPHLHGPMQQSSSLRA